MQQLCRIVIDGETASSVQGAELRETVQKIARGMGITGQIRNVKGKPRVEVICGKEKSDLLFEEINKLKKRGDVLFRIKNIFKTDELFDDFQDFDVVREDDLSEMVWALQGAGKVFVSASKKVEDMPGYKKSEVIGRLESVKKELLYAQGNIVNVDDFVCLKQFISDPLIDFTAEEKEEEDLIRRLIEFYHEFLYLKKYKEKLDEDKIDGVVKEIKGFVREIEIKINELKNDKFIWTIITKYNDGIWTLKTG